MREQKQLNVLCAEALGDRMDWPGASAAPYGDDTPEGWACTGPLIQRFKLTIEPDLDRPSRWVVSYPNNEPVDELVHEAIAGTACAAVAAWVARHGGKA